jgi:hypothetical protein
MSVLVREQQSKYGSIPDPQCAGVFRDQQCKWSYWTGSLRRAGRKRAIPTVSAYTTPLLCPHRRGTLYVIYSTNLRAQSLLYGKSLTESHPRGNTRKMDCRIFQHFSTQGLIELTWTEVTITDWEHLARLAQTNLCER